MGKFKSHIKQTVVVAVKLNILFHQINFTHKLRLAGVIWDMNRVVAIQNTESLLSDWALICSAS